MCNSKTECQKDPFCVAVMSDSWWSPGWQKDLSKAHSHRLQVDTARTWRTHARSCNRSSFLWSPSVAFLYCLLQIQAGLYKFMALHVMVVLKLYAVHACCLVLSEEHMLLSPRAKQRCSSLSTQT
jgi:hypothetical protein